MIKCHLADARLNPVTWDTPLAAGQAFQLVGINALRGRESERKQERERVRGGGGDRERERERERERAREKAVASEEPLCPWSHCPLRSRASFVFFFNTLEPRVESYTSL